jgi:glycosyltransferase involved in cell wall biosynthesis
MRLARLAVTTVRLTKKARRLLGGRPAAIVHAHDLDTLPAAWLLARAARARLVYDAHELYTGFEPDPPRAWLRTISSIEGALARRSNAVVTVSSPIANELARRHRLVRHPLVVLNCPPLSASGPTAHSGTLRVIYQAAAGPRRDLNALTPIVTLEGIEVSARVIGVDSAPPGIHLLEPVQPDRLVEALDPFDVGLVIDQPSTDNARLALPNKLFEYLMAGLAVVVPDAPAMAELVQAECVGKIYRSGRLGEVLASMAEDRAGTEELRRRARTAAVERYNAEAQRPIIYEAWGLS